MTSQYGRVGKLTAAEENGAALLEILLQAAALVQHAPGCQLYAVSKDADQPGTIWVMELWESQAAHAASLTLPGVRELIAQAMPLLTEQPDGATLIPMGGVGL